VTRVLAHNTCRTTSSAIVPDIQRAYFECMTCLAPEEVDIVNGRIAEPTKVPHFSLCTSCREAMCVGWLHALLGVVASALRCCYVVLG